MTYHISYLQLHNKLPQNSALETQAFTDVIVSEFRNVGTVELGFSMSLYKAENKVSLGALDPCWLLAEGFPQFLFTWVSPQDSLQYDSCLSLQRANERPIKLATMEVRLVVLRITKAEFLQEY